MKINDAMFVDDSMALTAPSKQVEPKIKKLDDVYESHAKLVFLVDCSSSMDWKMSVDFVGHFIWLPEIMQKIKDAAEAVFAQVGPSLGAASVVLPEVEKRLWEMVTPASGKVELPDGEIKRRVVQFSMTDYFQVPKDWSKENAKIPSRMDVVKKLATREMEKRLNKNPKADIALVRFDNAAEISFNKGTRDELLKAIEKLMPCGGTDILAGIAAGMAACADAPSPIGLHHFIIVSDGEDYKASNEIGNWVPTLKASGVVLDYIHIGDLSENQGLAAACKMLEGELCIVSTESDFEEKFVEKVSRKLLPAPAAEVSA